MIFLRGSMNSSSLRVLWLLLWLLNAYLANPPVYALWGVIASHQISDGMLYFSFLRLGSVSEQGG